jgi:hypothetical protein
MDLSKFLGDNSYRILISANLIAMLSMPIQIVNLILLGKLSFPFVSLPVNIPWYVVIFGGLSFGIFSLWCIGFIMEKKSVAKHQNRISNQNNPQIMEILERISRIEERLGRE